ncbi:hypothetical protein GCM10022253_29870 [Sphingomonas endophytica]|uniref:Uncharacterized protein n=1 Tax=Sphingomonas endophytica TaxID=869719 RepID=A0ABR6N7A5_9SPHN|nr:hypothetical protein [Sphingomonas endophytica]
MIRGRVALVDRRKVGLSAHIFAQVRLNAHGRANLDEFTEAICGFPEVLDAHMGRVVRGRAYRDGAPGGCRTKAADWSWRRDAADARRCAGSRRDEDGSSASRSADELV